MHLPKSIRTVLAWIVSATLATTLALVSAPPASAATETTYRVTAARLNVRAGHSTKSEVLRTLNKGQHVLVIGRAHGRWLPISFNGTTAYVSKKYVVKDRRPVKKRITGPTGTKTAIKKIGVRAKPFTRYPRIKYYAKGTVVRVTGQVRGRFTRVITNDTKGWTPTRRLSAVTSTLPDTVADYVTTDVLALRTKAKVSASNQKTIPTGSTVSGTGVNSGSYSQVVYGKKEGWVITGYLKATEGTDPDHILPLSSTTLYVTASTDLIAAPAAGAERIAKASLAAKLRGTGVVTGDYTEVIWNGSTAWALSSAVSVSLGSSSLDRLESNGKAAVIEIRQNFPQITTIYGWRSSSNYSSDHPNGRAVDFMIPSYKSNKALGDALAAYVIENRSRLNITYVIWRQRIWTPYSGKWRAMEDRGSPTANHMDHVHVSFETSSK